MIMYVLLLSVLLTVSVQAVETQNTVAGQNALDIANEGNVQSPVDVEKLMDQVNNRYIGDDYSGVLTLQYASKSGSKKEMVLRNYSRKQPSGRQTLLKFSKPSFMAGSGVLLHSFDDEENLQWLFLSRTSRKEPRKIAGSEKGEPLFGTDISYIDIESKKTQDFTYERITPPEAEAETPYMVIQAIPHANDYPYSKTLSWVDPATSIEMKVEYFKNNELSKTLTVVETKQIDGIWTVTKAEIDNKARGSHTTVLLDQLHYNTGLGEGQFNFRALTSRM